MYPINYNHHGVNSSRLGDANMHHWTGSSLVQVMACHLFGAEPSPEPMLTYWQRNLLNKFQWHFDWNIMVFTEEDIFEHVICRMMTILFWPQCVNPFFPATQIPQCTSPKSLMHHVITEMCTRAHFCYKAVHCGIPVWCSFGFVRWIYWYIYQQWQWGKMFSMIWVFCCFVLFQLVFSSQQITVMSCTTPLALAPVLVV